MQKTNKLSAITRGCIKKSFCQKDKFSLGRNDLFDILLNVFLEVRN